MNIAIVSPEFPTHNNLGGVATFNYNFCKLLVDLKHTVFVFCKRSSLFYSTYELEHVQIITVDYRFENKIYNILYSNIFTNTIKSIVRNFLPVSFAILEWNLFSFLALRKLKKKKKVDVAFCTDFFSSGLLTSFLFSDIKWIQHIHGPVIIFEKFRKQSIDLKIQKILELIDIKFIGNKKKIAYSKLLVNDLKKKCAINSIQYIQNFIQLEKKILPSTTTNKNNLVYFGRFEKRKGVDELVKAFIKLAENNINIKLYLIGDNIGDDFGIKNDKFLFDFIDMEKISPKVSSRIICVPRIDNRFFLEKIIRTLNGIVILPSRYEPLGFTTIESLLLGQVVIASKNAEMLIQDGISGFYCKPTSDSILKCIDTIFKKNDDELYKIKSNAIDYIIEKHKYATAKREYKKILEQV